MVVLLIFVLLLALTGWAVAARLAGAAAPLRTDTARLRAELAAVGAAGAAARVEVGRLEARLDAQREAAATFAQAEDRLHDAFAAASRDALEHNSRAFLDLAGTRLAQQQALAAGDLDQRRLAVESLISPLHDALTRVEQNMAGLESARTSAYAGLQQQVRGLTDAQERLRTETAQLTSALRSPQVRGRWGEVQLRRVIELAGMTAHCDFVEQVSVVRAGAVRRPDVIVTLPGGHQLAIDAKVPLAAYLQAHETTDDEKRAILLRDHAGQVRAHVNGLASKEYWEQFSDSPDLVVLFIPGDPFLAAAYEQDAGLWEYAQSRHVLLATPTSLIGLLQSVALGWRHEAMADNARAVCDAGRELYKRLATMGDHVSTVGRSLDRAVEAYNKQVGSLETRVLPAARRLAALEVTDGEFLAPEPVERLTRALQSEELAPATSGGASLGPGGSDASLRGAGGAAVLPAGGGEALGAGGAADALPGLEPGAVA